MSTDRRTIPLARLSDVQENEPAPDRKCDDCGGDGVVPMINRAGYQCGTARCPTCGGTRYAP